MEKQEMERRLKEAGTLKWFHRFEVVEGSGVYTPGWVNASPENYNWMFSGLNLDPGFFRGKRCLDIGTSTGALAFYLEGLGANVTAIDICESKDRGFAVVHEIRGSKVEFRRASVYDLNPDDFGHFDIIMFFGVYYHLKHPLLAFERINSIGKEGSLLLGGGATCDRWYHDDDLNCERGVNLGLISKEIIADEKILSVKNLNDLPLCGFSAGHFLRDNSNWFIPNSACVANWIKAAGFQVESSFSHILQLDLDWNTNGVSSSSFSFKAAKSGKPLPENSELHDYQIPTSLELQRARETINRLEAQLCKYEAAKGQCSTGVNSNV
jgi:SAM-dependent methyltransferase